jgi:hypothetical protein
MVGVKFDRFRRGGKTSGQADVLLDPFWQRIKALAITWTMRSSYYAAFERYEAQGGTDQRVASGYVRWATML